MDTDATDEQRTLLDVSTRFMQDACPLRAVRDGTWREPGFATSTPNAAGFNGMVMKTWPSPWMSATKSYPCSIA